MGPEGEGRVRQAERARETPASAVSFCVRVCLFPPLSSPLPISPVSVSLSLSLPLFLSTLLPCLSLSLSCRSLSTPHPPPTPSLPLIHTHTHNHPSADTALMDTPLASPTIQSPSHPRTRDSGYHQAHTSASRLSWPVSASASPPWEHPGDIPRLPAVGELSARTHRPGHTHAVPTCASPHLPTLERPSPVLSQRPQGSASGGQDLCWAGGQQWYDGLQV